MFCPYLLALGIQDYPEAKVIRLDVDQEGALGCGLSASHQVLSSLSQCPPLHSLSLPPIHPKMPQQPDQWATQGHFRPGQMPKKGPFWA